jgi:hypothetical protein
MLMTPLFILAKMANVHFVSDGDHLSILISIFWHMKNKLGNRLAGFSTYFRSK